VRVDITIVQSGCVDDGAETCPEQLVRGQVQGLLQEQPGHGDGGRPRAPALEQDAGLGRGDADDLALAALLGRFRVGQFVHGASLPHGAAV